jgi:hypothetical protein
VVSTQSTTRYKALIFFFFFFFAATRPQLRFAVSGTNGDRKGQEASGWRVEDPKQTMGTQKKPQLGVSSHTEKT